MIFHPINPSKILKPEFEFCKFILEGFDHKIQHFF